MTAPENSPPPLPVTFRPGRARLALLLLGALGFVSLLAVAIALPSGGAISWSLGERIALAGSGALIWGLLGLLARPYATATEDGLTVVNLTTRRTLEWAQVVRVNLRSGDAWVSLDLLDGSTLPVMGIQPANGRAWAVTEARRLRDLVDHYGTSPASA